MSLRPEEGSHLEQILGFSLKKCAILCFGFWITAHVKDPKLQQSEECGRICGLVVARMVQLPKCSKQTEYNAESDWQTRISRRHRNILQVNTENRIYRKNK